MRSDPGLVVEAKPAPFGLRLGFACSGELAAYTGGAGYAGGQNCDVMFGH